MDIPWDDAQLFLLVAESGSLSAAARRLGMTQPTVSRKLAELEVALGEPLFDRERTGVSLTEFGQRLLGPAREMARWAAELSTNAAQRPSPRGVVRITVPPGIGHLFLAPWALEARAHLPDIDLHVISTVRPLDMVRREADLALRLDGTTDDCVASVELSLLPFAAAAYIDRHPGAREPAELDWIGWTPAQDDLSPNNVLRRLVPDARLTFASDDYLLQMRACELGLGVMLLPAPHPTFAAPACLQRVDVAIRPIRRTLSLIAPRAAQSIPRVNAVLERLAASLAEWEGDSAAQ